MYEYWLDKKILEFKACVAPQHFISRSCIGLNPSPSPPPPSRSFVTQQTELQQQKEQQIQELEKQVMSLFNFGQKLTTIIGNHEHGTHPLTLKP
jgi:hypothetical protein